MSVDIGAEWMKVAVVSVSWGITVDNCLIKSKKMYVISYSDE